MIPLRPGRLGLCLLLALLGVLALPAPAARAHAVLETTVPADGAHVDTAPVEVELTFNEPVTGGLGAVRVFDSAGARVDRGDSGAGPRPETLRVGLADGLDDGTYVVSWRAVSADDHPINGAFVFTVGAGADTSDDIVATILAQTGGDGRVIGVLAVVLRALMYGGVLLAAGGVVFLLRVHRGDEAARRPLLLVVRTAAAVALVATVAGFATQGALVSGLGAAALANVEVLREIATSSYGRAAAVRVVGLALLLAGAGRRWDAGGAPLSLVGAAACLVSFVLTGHAVSGEPRWLMTVADLLHTLAAAVWAGGLVLLLVALRQQRSTGDAAAKRLLIARFSALATLALAGVVLAGVGLAWAQVRAPRALLGTAYGWTLLAKLAVAAAVIAGGAYNNRRLVPAVRAGDRDAPQRLRGILRVEIAGLAAVIVVTAVLVNLVPAREAAGITGPYTTTVGLGAEYQLTVVVDPNRAGINDLHIYTLGADGRPADLAGVRIALSQPAREIAPITREPPHVGPGHWQLTGPELSIPGQWQLDVTARVSDLEEQTVSLAIPVN